MQNDIEMNEIFQPEIKKQYKFKEVNEMKKNLLNNIS